MSGAPLLSIQTATLYASGDNSTFTGTGGPFGFSPFTSQFGGTISSAGLAGEPFSDAVYSVAAGDELTFVIAVQNVTAGAAAYGVTLKEAMPTGLVLPADGIGLTVTDGLGNDLASSGNLFGPAGLTITPALAGYDPNSGQNIDLITFSLDAGAALPGPYATVQPVATIASYAATLGGANLTGANPASAATTFVTAAPTPVVTPETDPTAVAVGQTETFDVALAIPAGTLNNLRIAPVLPAGAASLALVSTAVTSVGAGLQASTPVIGADGSISFASVSNAAAAGDTTIAARITVRAQGTASAPATLQTVVSAASPSSPGGTWSASVSSSVGVVAPPPPPTLSGLPTNQVTTTGTTTSPFAALAIADANPAAQTGTIAISLQNGSLGQLSVAQPATQTGAASGSLDAAGDTYFATGTLAALQAASRQLQFTAAAAGTAAFTVTVVDAAGGVAQNTAVDVTISPSTPTPTPPPAPAPSPDPLFDAAYYLAHNPDVAAAGVDPYQHYMAFGWKEGRNPDADFDSKYYLTQNKDVAGAGANPLTHFELFGWKEGRDPSLAFSDSQYLAVNPDVAAAHVDPLLHYILFGQAEGRSTGPANAYGTADPLVNAAYYDPQLGATIIPSAGSAGAQAASSYHNGGGWQQGLNPDAFFNTAYYLAHNPDVAAAHVDPLLHYELFGWKEGRDASAAFSTNKYLAAYADVKAANVDPLLHFVQFGQAEGRTAFAA